MKGSCRYDSRVAPVNVFLIAPQFRCLPIKAGKGGKRLPLVLCDTMGLESQPDTGLAVEDLYNIYKGRIADRYQVQGCWGVVGDILVYLNAPERTSTLRSLFHVS